jgi:hypothetical protein
MVKGKHKGACSELVACAWLLEQGYEVFRNVSSHGLVDLIALKENIVTFFDVKTWDSLKTRHPPRLSVAQKQLGVKLLAVKASGDCEIDPELHMIQKNCAYCGALFETGYPTKIHCSSSCRAFMHAAPLVETKSSETFLAACDLRA